MVMRNGPAIRTRVGPFDFAGGVGFLLPDGNAGLDGIDEEAVCLEGGLTVRRGGQGDHSTFADGKCSHPVNGEGSGDRKFFHRLGQDPPALLNGENRMVAVVQLLHVASFVMISNEAFEDDEGSACGVGHLGAQGEDIDGKTLDLEHGKGRGETRAPRWCFQSMAPPAAMRRCILEVK